MKALRLSEEALKHFSRGRSSVEVTEYLDRLATWMGEVNTQNHDGVTLTPAIVRFLASAEDLESGCLLYTSPSPRDRTRSRMPSSA